MPGCLRRFGLAASRAIAGGLVTNIGNFIGMPWNTLHCLNWLTSTLFTDKPDLKTAPNNAARANNIIEHEF
jgi:hypothetical protein